LESLDSSASFNNPAFRKRLIYIQNERALAYIIVDNENNSTEQMLKLVKRGLVSENCYRIWDGEFESDNWTDEEILGQVQTIASEKSVHIKITAQDLDEYRDSKAQERKSQPMVTKIIETLLNRTGSGFSIEGRKIDLNKRLALVTSTRITRMLQEGTYSAESPIEEELVKISDIARFGLPRNTSSE
jgi:hypothetical protein